MRVAALHDVHGNLPALEAVLAEVAAIDVDRIVCGGDVVAGPYPRECLERLLGFGAAFVRGNADHESPRAPAGLWDWVAARLDPVSLDFLEQLPQSVALGGVRYCHGSPRDEDEILTRISPDERFGAALAGVEERLVVGGHTHVQYVREVGWGDSPGDSPPPRALTPGTVPGTVPRWLFANAGSVGMPYEGRPGAFWALVEGEAVEHRHTPYAVDAACAAIRGSGYPLADDLCSLLLDPKDPDEVSAYFESIAA